MAKRSSEEKIIKTLSQYGLQNLSDENDRNAVYKIAKDLYGTGMMDAGVRLQLFAKATDKLQVIYQRAIIEQNWVIIRALDRIASNREK